MYELPASVRLSVWLTHAFRFRRPLTDAVADALPDVDDVDPAVERLQLWRDMGERVVCVDLPQPGMFGSLLPPTSAAAAVASEVGECLFVPSLGGALVPRLEVYGPADDEGLRLTLEPHDSDPVPAHRLEMLALPDIDRRFRETMLREVELLEELGAMPLSASRHRAAADERAAAAQWALPPGLPSRAVRIITTAGLVLAALDQARAVPAGHDASSHSVRDAALRRLSAQTQTTMAEATTVAALELGGYR